MGLFEIFVLALGLSMDAFAVSVCKGLSLGKINGKHMVTAGIWFGGFQALMPLIGYFLGSFFADMISRYAHLIAFVLLCFIGESMIKESFGKTEELDRCMNVKTMFILAVATSIDALAVGVSFAFLKVNIFLAIIVIGITTFICSAVGIKIGSIFGAKYKSKAEFAGGFILIIIGIKILIEGLN